MEKLVLTLGNISNSLTHTWSISSNDSNLAIGANAVQLSASSNGWLNDENFEHLKKKHFF